MKKILSIALCAAAVSAFGETVTVLGQVGVTAITNSLSNTIIAVSYDDLAGGPGMVVSNLVKTTNLTKGDQLAVFNGGTGMGGIYDTWVLAENANGALYWEKSDKTFTVEADGQLKEGTGTAASGITNAVGTGIWLVRQNPIDTNGNTNSFYIYGKPVSNPTSTTVAGNWTLIGNPKQEQIDLKDVSVKGVASGDLIVAIDANGKPQYYINNGTGWIANIGGTATSLGPIGAGMGVWIKTDAEATIQWDVKPTDESLNKE